MKFRAERAEFARAVASVAQGLPVRPANPVQLGMLVHAEKDLIQLTASDGDTTFNMAVPGEIGEEGSFIFPRVFPDTVKSLAGNDIDIEVKDNQGTLACGRSKYTFSVEDGKSYPFPLLDVPELGEADGEAFRTALKQVLPAASKDNPVPALTAIMLVTRMGELTLVATDKYALACSELDWEQGDCDYDDMTCLLLARLAERVARMDGERVRIGWDDKRFQARSGGFTITCRLMDGQFPKQWDKILKAEGNWTRLPEDLASVVKRAALALHPADGGGIYLDFGDDPGNVLTVNATGKAKFTESLDIELNCEPVSVKVGYEMLLDALQWCDEVLVERGKPLVLRGEGCRWMVQVRRGDGQA